MAAIFKTVSWEVDQLVQGVAQGTIRLPDLQRPFVWPATKVRDLFDSMYRGYPVGVLMFWDVPAAEGARAISGAAATQGAAHQIIDGQQRLTSLYAAMKGAPVRDENYRSREIRIAFNPFSEKFEVRTPVLAKQTVWLEDVSAFFADPIKATKAYKRRYRESGQEWNDDVDDDLDRVFQRLSNLGVYKFDVVQIQPGVDKQKVADVFVRINSEGVRLKAYDYILTWLSVFWPEGREDMEEFSRNSRISAAHASEVLGRKIMWTARNPYLNVDNGHLVRAAVALGQRRGRLQDAYAALQAKDTKTGYVDAERQDRELDKLKAALPVVTNPVNWDEFIHSVQAAGFRSSQNITSAMNIVYSYVIFLLGRHEYKVDLATLRVLVARWLFMSQLTARYTGSSESQIQKDIDRLSEVRRGDSAGFVKVLDAIIDAQLTPDFWRYSVPQQLITSGAGLSPHYQCYLAALNILDANLFMVDSRVRDWMDPSLAKVKGSEGHHLFPRAYQESQLGITDIKRINQVANFAPTDWNTNILISDKPPAEYWEPLKASRSKGAKWLEQQMYWHALPAGWETLAYDDFLSKRRELMAKVIRDAFARLSGGIGVELVSTTTKVDTPDEPTLQQLLERGVLKPGDLLDPVAPEWVVDAVITNDGTVQIDGTEAFDSLDEAARSLGVTNLTGLEFWALEMGGEVHQLTGLHERPTAALGA